MSTENTDAMQELLAEQNKRITELTKAVTELTLVLQNLQQRL